jgi:dUTP pyrophosphatase
MVVNIVHIIIKKMKVNFKKVNKKAVTPTYAKDGDAGLDITSISREIVITGDYEYVEYGTGLAFEIPVGHVGLLFPRSSVSKKDMFLSNAVGVIDSGYRGEVSFRFKRLAWDSTLYNVGEKIGQLVIIPYPQIELELVKELSETERGENGYGSTGL